MKFPHIPTTQELRLAVEAARKEHLETVNLLVCADTMFADALDDGDNEAVCDIQPVIDMAIDSVALAETLLVCAKAAYSARVN